MKDYLYGLRQAVSATFGLCVIGLFGLLFGLVSIVSVWFRAVTGQIKRPEQRRPVVIDAAALKAIIEEQRREQAQASSTTAATPLNKLNRMNWPGASSEN